MTIKILNLEEVRDIYDTQMRDTFPPSELRPYNSIESLTNQGCYFCCGLFEEEYLLAYAFFSRVNNGRVCLLDYFAVVKELRGHGVGSRFFTLLREELKDMDSILLEVESVESTEDECEKIIRRRRIAFYEHNGCEMTNVKCFLYGVDYCIMALSVTKPIPESRTVLSELERIYHLMFDDTIYDRICRPFLNE